jgi:uncharacterized protein (UPF0335 family)
MCISAGQKEMKEMVDDVHKDLKARGFDRKQIVYEKYD